MKLIIFLVPLVFFTCACNNKQADKTGTEQQFDKTKWQTKDDKDYPYRDKMLKDLMGSGRLKGLKRDSVLYILGEPTRIDTNYLFYRVAQKRLGFFPLSTKSLVIKFKADSTVEWVKTHE